MNPDQARQIFREEIERYFKSSANPSLLTLMNLVKSDRFFFERHLNFADGRDVQVGKGTGTTFATEATQKMGFYGAAPVAQQTGVAVTAGGVHAALVALGFITA